ncbi:hypothetical protein [Massilia frigida]|uniref:hypothetical protein n=1 Tax=Massilia frigida TaxID=2609281 RepID=UPI001420BDF9|nr:hypothetical protein [Massilia frigida]
MTLIKRNKVPLSAWLMRVSGLLMAAPAIAMVPLRPFINEVTSFSIFPNGDVQMTTLTPHAYRSRDGDCIGRTKASGLVHGVLSGRKRSCIRRCAGMGRSIRGATVSPCRAALTPLSATRSIPVLLRGSMSAQTDCESYLDEIRGVVDGGDGVQYAYTQRSVFKRTMPDGQWERLLLKSLDLP